MNLDKILDEAIAVDASDVHLICDNKPMLRIARKLVPVQNSKVLTPDDMSELYDYLVKGNVDKDEVYSQTRKLDMAYEYKGIRLRVNISLSDDIPVCTMRLIKNDLPPYESLRSSRYCKKNDIPTTRINFGNSERQTLVKVQH